MTLRLCTRIWSHQLGRCFGRKKAEEQTGGTEEGRIGEGGFIGLAPASYTFHLLPPLTCPLALGGTSPRPSRAGA